MRCTATFALFRSQILATRTAAGRFLSAPVLAMLAGMAAAAAGIVPPVSAVYDAVFSHVMPLAAALCLLEADLAECALRRRNYALAALLAVHQRFLFREGSLLRQSVPERQYYRV